MAVLAAASLGLSAFSSLSSTLGGFFGAGNAAYEANKRRVAEIDAANQQKHFENLTIRARFQNQSNQLAQNLDNIRTATGQARAEAQKRISQGADEALISNRDNFIKMMRSRTGSRSNQMNVGDRTARAQMGRAVAGNEAKKNALFDTLLSKEYVTNRAAQNAASLEKAKVGTAPIYQQYQTDYVAQNQSPGFGDYLKLAGGLAGAAVQGFGAYDEYKNR
tara:strand:+ start:2152 stop:2811 length:660 start_codon:yes stop_codon:yes gene_type:complete